MDFREVQGREISNGIYLLNCIEIMVSKKPREDVDAYSRKNEKFNSKRTTPK